jgi:hypothetical protein
MPQLLRSVAVQPTVAASAGVARDRRRARVRVVIGLLTLGMQQLIGMNPVVPEQGEYHG